MANDLKAVMPKLLAQGLLALREEAIMPRIVNRQYESLAGEKGSTIDVPIPSAIAAQDVVPGPTPPNDADINPTSVPIVLDQWKEAPFYLTDKDLLEVMSGVIPMQASEAIKSLANTVDRYIFDQLLLGVPFAAGTLGTIPFASDDVEYRDARKTLNKNLAPKGDRMVVLDPDAESNALALAQFRDLSQSGDPDPIINGQIGRKIGAMWFMDQNVKSHTFGDAAGFLTNGARAVGDVNVPVDTGTGTFNPGDTVTFAGHSTPYVVAAFAGNVITLNMGLKAIVADNAAVTLGAVASASGAVNWHIHRDCVAFANRPFSGGDGGSQLGALFQSAVDPISSLTLRLEITRQHKRTRYAYDLLYGGKVVRPELGCRIYGGV